MTRIQRIGIIAEDSSDYDSARTIIKRVTGKNNLGFKPKIGHGCGRVRSKCVAWAEELMGVGCDMLILIHDLDRKDLRNLRTELEERFNPEGLANRIVCIPVEEIEAWFLSDPEGIKTALRLSKAPKISGDPESISSPKEKLEEYIRVCSGGKFIYLNVRHNRLLAENVSIKSMAEKCPSFDLLRKFILGFSY